MSLRESGATDLWPASGNLALRRLVMLMTGNSVVYNRSNRPYPLSPSRFFYINFMIDDVYLVSLLGSLVLLSWLLCSRIYLCDQLCIKTLLSRESSNMYLQFIDRLKANCIQGPQIGEDLKTDPWTL